MEHYSDLAEEVARFMATIRFHYLYARCRNQGGYSPEQLLSGRWAASAGNGV
ncbi:MAG: hypothetical protein ACLS43_09910 [Evtepia gabavorous]